MCKSPKYKRNRFGQLSRCVSLQDVKQIGTHIGIDWETAEFSPEDFQEGIRVELEHGAVDPKTDVTHDDPYATAKIAWAHLLERPDYYQKLLEMESGRKKPPKSIKYRGARYALLGSEAEKTLSLEQALSVIDHYANRYMSTWQESELLRLIKKDLEKLAT